MDKEGAGGGECGEHAGQGHPEAPGEALVLAVDAAQRVVEPEDEQTRAVHGS